MTNYTELWQGGPLYAQAEHFRLGTDSVLLADFVSLSGAKRGIDLGCGGGILTLLLLTRSETLQMTGLEILPGAAGQAEDNLRINGLETRGHIVCGDIRSVRSSFRSVSFDLVVAVRAHGRIRELRSRRSAVRRIVPVLAARRVNGGGCVRTAKTASAPGIWNRPVLDCVPAHEQHTWIRQRTLR